MAGHETHSRAPLLRSTTVVGVRVDGRVALGSDGQVSLGETVLKHGATKIRRIYNDKVLAGFAGSTADAITLYEKFEGKLEEYHGNLKRSAVELAKEWRQDRVLRRLEALLIVADTQTLLIISGNGDVIEPDDGICAIGSGGPFALAAARALVRHAGMSAREVALEALKIASEICIYTNDQIKVEEL